MDEVHQQHASPPQQQLHLRPAEQQLQDQGGGDMQLQAEQTVAAQEVLQQLQQAHELQAGQQQEEAGADQQQAQQDIQQQLETQAELQQQLQQQYDQQLQQQGGYQLHQQVWYQLDARGKIEDYDEDDWFVPEVVPFKRRQNVSSTMAASRPHPWKRVRHHVAADNYHQLPADTPTYVSLEAPPPLYPPKRYCDITGCEAPYADPKTHLRYANAEAFRIARSLTDDEVQARLGIRNAQSVLK